MQVEMDVKGRDELARSPLTSIQHMPKCCKYAIHKENLNKIVVLM